MKKNLVALTTVLGLTLAAGAIGVAQQEPADSVNASRHPNLAAAQQLIRQAYQKIEAAQRANREELGGHAKKAEELLDQASHELALAAGVSNQDEKRH
jgi:hypothetical protein